MTYLLGIISGTVGAVFTRPKLKLELHDDLFGSAVCCYLDESQYEYVSDMESRHVSITGMIRRDPDTGRPIEVRNVKSVKLIEEAPPGSYRQARGAVPWHEGDEPAEVTIRRIRDAG